MQPIDVDVIVPRRRACREYFFCSPTSAWRYEKADPSWPTPVEMSEGRYGYRMSDIKRHLASRKEKKKGDALAPQAALDAAAAARERRKASKFGDGGAAL